MIDADDFKELLESQEHLVHKPGDELNAAMEGGGLNEFLEEERVWWAARGVDVQALRGYCVWEAEDTLRAAMKAANVPEEVLETREHVGMVMAPQTLKALLASTVEMAFSVGWHMRARADTKVTLH